jgi:hypothetical protein
MDEVCPLASTGQRQAARKRKTRASAIRRILMTTL